MTVPIALLSMTIGYFIVMAAWLYREARLDDVDITVHRDEGRSKP